LAAENAGRLLLILLLASTGTLALSATLPEPAPSGQRLFPGRMIFGLSALPDGELLAPCEDQSVSVVDARANVLASWQAGSRIALPVSVAPSGPLQLLAVPQVSGRVDVLAYDKKTLHLAGQFALTYPSVPATPTVWDANGHLYQTWCDGHLESWNGHGVQLWAANLEFTPLFALNDDSLGLFVAGPAKLVLLDHQGNLTRTWQVLGNPRGILQTLAGNFYLWSETGLWLLPPTMEGWKRVDDSQEILGVATDRQNRLVVTEAGRFRRLGAFGSVLTLVALPRRALGPGVIDDRGRVFVPTVSGMEQWSYDGHFLGKFGGASPCTSPVLTKGGLIAWGGNDWVLQVLQGGSLAPFSWAQNGGGPQRAWSTTRPTALLARTQNWADEPEFGYFLQLASSGDDIKQQRVLELFEEKDEQGTLLSTWPFANVILLKILHSGLTDLEFRNNQVVNNWPGNRLRAYRLLTHTSNPEDRDDLLVLLSREFDAVNLAQGSRALAATGWDGDGQIMRTLALVQGRRPAEPVLADALLDCARDLWLAGGNNSDAAMVPMVTAIYQAELPRLIRLKAQKFFQEILESP